MFMVIDHDCVWRVVHVSAPEQCFRVHAWCKLSAWGSDTWQEVTHLLSHPQRQQVRMLRIDLDGFDFDPLLARTGSGVTNFTIGVRFEGDAGFD